MQIAAKSTLDALRHFLLTQAVLTRVLFIFTRVLANENYVGENFVFSNVASLPKNKTSATSFPNYPKRQKIIKQMSKTALRLTNPYCNFVNTELVLLRCV